MVYEAIYKSNFLAPFVGGLMYVQDEWVVDANGQCGVEPSSLPAALLGAEFTVHVLSFSPQDITRGKSALTTHASDSGWRIGFGVNCVHQ